MLLLLLFFQLVVHVGVSGIATELTLEQQAHNDGYDKMDVQGKCPETQCCVDDRDKNCVLVSGIDMERVCSKVNSAGIKVKARVSHDPGRYVFNGHTVKFKFCATKDDV